MFLGQYAKAAVGCKRRKNTQIGTKTKQIQWYIWSAFAQALAHILTVTAHISNVSEVFSYFGQF